MQAIPPSGGAPAQPGMSAFPQTTTPLYQQQPTYDPNMQGGVGTGYAQPQQHYQQQPGMPMGGGGGVAGVGVQQQGVGAGAQAGAPGGPKVSAGLQNGANKAQALLNKHGGKYGAWMSSQVQVQVDALAKVPLVGDINSGGPPVIFSVHKAGGAFSKDDQVLNADKSQVLYYLEFPHSFRSSWNLTMHTGSKNGPVLCTLLKGSYGFTAADIQIHFTSGFQTILAKPSLITKAHEFIGLDGHTKFKWKSDGMLSSYMTCQDLTTGKVAAQWEHSYSYGKDGICRVNPEYLFMQDLLVVTALAMEEWRREEEAKKPGNHATSNTNLLAAGIKMLSKR